MNVDNVVSSQSKISDENVGGKISGGDMTQVNLAIGIYQSGCDNDFFEFRAPPYILFVSNT